MQGDYYCHDKQIPAMGSGCGSVGRAVTSNTRSPQFESSQRQTFTQNIFYCQLYWKDENKEKEAGKGPFKKILTRVAVLLWGHQR